MSRHQRQRRSRSRSNPFTRIILAVIVLCLCGLIGGAAYAVSWVVNTADSAPNISHLRPRIQGQLSEVFASNGELLGYLSTDVLRRALSQGQQPIRLRQATVAIEDRRFFQHGGVDYQGMARAAIDDIFNGNSDTQGGSTLTMQLVKNIYLPAKFTATRSLKYKIVQAKLANELEDRHSKNWILTQYLNDVPYGTVDGQNAYGVGAAAQMFFDDSNLKKLTLPQVALLAGLPQAPTTYNPFLHPGAAKARRAEVLAAMVQSGFITRADEQIADAAPLGLKANSYYRTVRQPYVFDYIRQQLIDKLGEQTVDRGGLKVYSSINLSDQAYAKAALEDNEGEPGDPDAALVTVNPATGQIVAMAQNTTYGLGSDETTLNYVTQAKRQTGSAFKVFSLMDLIKDQDGDPNATYYDSKLLNAGWLPADPTWSVHTSEDSYQGSISITKATALSDNTVYAQLGADLGLDSVMSMAYSMGITTRQEGPYYPDLIGGLNPGVTPLQMADAYATLASGGLHHSPTIINSVTLPGGQKKSLLDTQPERVFTDGQAYEGTKTLETVLQYGTAAGDEPNGCPSAGKTGTTSNYTDAYFVGYTPHLSTAVWVGYTNEAESMTDVNGLGPGFGGTLAAPIWKQFMESAMGGNCDDFPTPTTPFSGTAYQGAHSAAYATPQPYYSTSAPGSAATTPATTGSTPASAATTPATGGGAVTTPDTGAVGGGTAGAVSTPASAPSSGATSGTSGGTGLGH